MQIAMVGGAVIEKDLSEEGTIAEPSVRPLGKEFLKQKMWIAQMFWYESVFEVFINNEKVHDIEP